MYYYIKLENNIEYVFEANKMEDCLNYLAKHYFWEKGKTMWSLIISGFNYGREFEDNPLLPTDLIPMYNNLLTNPAFGIACFLTLQEPFDTKQYIAGDYKICHLV